MRISGIDPGLTGAIAVIDTDHWTLSIADMPREPGTAGKNAVSPTGVVQIMNRFNPDYTFVESVWSSPQQGVASAFSFGRSLGVVLGASASRSALTLVRPTVWKSATNTPRDKNQARARAQALFPNAYSLLVRVKDDGRAEAALLAFYGVLSLKLTPPRPLTLVEYL
jgi:crossover junction endodeoxyribonuclease RuvC